MFLQIPPPPETGSLDRWLIGALVIVVIGLATLYNNEIRSSRDKETLRANTATTELSKVTDQNKGMREVIDSQYALLKEVAAHVAANHAEQMRIGQLLDEHFGNHPRRRQAP